MATITQRAGRFRVQVRKGGKCISKTFALESDAQKWARQQEVDIERGVFKTTTTTTIDQAIKRYREAREQAGREVKRNSNEDYMLRHLADDLNGVAVAACSPERLIQWAKVRKFAGAGPATINMDLSKLGTVLRTVASLSGESFPDVVGNARPALNHLGLIGTGGKRDRRPTEAELQKIKAHCGKWLCDIIDLARIIGLRRGEIVRIRWDDLDVPRRLILVRDRKDPKKKAGNDQWIPLLGEAFDIVSRQPKVEEEIFPYHPMSISKAFQRACNEAGVEDLHFHDLRHDAASNLFELGMEIPEVAAVTGHKTWSQLKRYTNIRPEAVAESFQEKARLKLVK